eukprot:5791790-Pyramimonas_sp.AAC.1
MDQSDAVSRMSTRAAEYATAARALRALTTKGWQAIPHDSGVVMRPPSLSLDMLRSLVTLVPFL